MSYESVWRTLVKPPWGDTRLDRVTHGEVVRWVAELTERGLSPSRITQALLCLKQVLALAVMDGRLARNAAEHVKPPRPRKAEPRFLTHEQVHDLAEACGRYRVFVLTAAYTGLRWGELRALRAKRIDLERGRIDVAEAMPERSLELDTPKNHKRRTVPIPGFVVEELEKHVQGKGPDDLVLPTQPGECSTTQTFAATSGTQQPGRLAWMASHLTIFAIQQLRWRSVRERTSRLCSDCSAMRQRR
jgi:integrase